MKLYESLRSDKKTNFRNISFTLLQIFKKHNHNQYANKKTVLKLVETAQSCTGIIANVFVSFCVVGTLHESAWMCSRYSLKLEYYDISQSVHVDLTIISLLFLCRCKKFRYKLAHICLLKNPRHQMALLAASEKWCTSVTLSFRDILIFILKFHHFHLLFSFSFLSSFVINGVEKRKGSKLFF